MKCDFCHNQIWGSYYAGELGNFCTVRCYLRWLGKAPTQDKKA